MLPRGADVECGGVCVKARLVPRCCGDGERGRVDTECALLWLCVRVCVTGTSGPPLPQFSLLPATWLPHTDAPSRRSDAEPRMKVSLGKPRPGLGVGILVLQVPVWVPHGGSCMFRTTAFSE